MLEQTNSMKKPVIEHKVELLPLLYLIEGLGFSLMRKIRSGLKL